MERDDTVAGPGRNSPLESTPDPKGVEFVRGQDLDEWEDMLIAAAKRVNTSLRAKGLLPAQPGAEVQG